MSYVVVNALFAIAYMFVGGIANARPGSFADAFFFSVQTLGTIGYGHLEPEALGAHALVLLESFVIITPTQDGGQQIDLTKFSDIEPTEPTADFPYPRQRTVDGARPANLCHS